MMIRQVDGSGLNKRVERVVIEISKHKYSWHSISVY